MTHEGGYKPLNRAGIETHTSPLLKMSFETTMHFLSEATLHGEADSITSPSSSIILGKPPKTGTGSFELHAQLNYGEASSTVGGAAGKDKAKKDKKKSKKKAEA